MTKCAHAASGCNYPQGECSGACLASSTQRQPAAPQYLTIVYQIHSPGQAQALLHATDWTAMSHSHAILDRDTAIKLRDALHAELNDIQDQRRAAFRAIERLNDELGQAREQIDVLREELKKAMDSLEYVEKYMPGLAGCGVRQERIAASRAAIDKTGGAA